MPPGDAFADLGEAARLVQQLSFWGRVENGVSGSGLPGRRADSAEQSSADTPALEPGPDVHVEDAGEIAVTKRPGAAGEAVSLSGVGGGVPGDGRLHPGQSEPVPVGGVLTLIILGVLF